MRRSHNGLTDASEAELSDYVLSLSVDQIAGLENNVKGIYRELAFQQRENLDGDEYIVELFGNTNHAKADVRIINTGTSDISEVQLKATNYASYVRQHKEKYENIEVLTTSEVAEASSDWGSASFSNVELTNDTTTALRKLDHGAEADILYSMEIAAMVMLARQCKVYVERRSAFDKSQTMIKD